MADEHTSALHTKVAGRVATLFFVCAGLPLTALAVLTIWRTTSELSTGATERLAYDARTLGQEAANRLHRLAEGLQSLTRAMELDDSATLGRGIAIADHLPTTPRGAVVRLSDGKIVRVNGTLSLPQLSAAQQRHLTSRGRLLTSNGQQPVLVVRGMRPGAIAAATVDERWIFGLDDRGHLPPDAAVCVSTRLARPECSIAVGRDAIADAFETVAGGPTTIATPSGPHTAWVTALDVQSTFRAEPWRYALMRPRSVIRQPILSFVKDLLLVLLLTGLVVAWLSRRQVQRQFRPLAALTTATERIRRHDFDQLVDVTSDDEFGLLGDAFNDMARELQQRFADLQAFNVGTLTTLARAIDAKSPWTAGHSERVTMAALKIADALGLSKDEIDQLRTGGLVHDIGKIATPIEILDKPTRLTPDEERIMRLHPEQGVHILEPIPAFRSILPIVAEHHEHWDGSGYPARLAGTAIARTARVLAVADVYDALRSDRPYRTGLSHARVVGVIRNGAGTHFDPSVVEAFLTIESALEQTPPHRVRGPFPASA